MVCKILEKNSNLIEGWDSGEFELLIEGLGVNAEGVGRLDSFTIFVEGALPGERVRVRIYERRKTFARAHVVKFLSRSPDRVEPSCPLFGRCGGCQLMHLEYSQQLEAKRTRVIDALQRIAKIDVEVMPCIASLQPLAYRNKIQLPVNDNLRLGLYARNTHDLIEIKECAIHSSLGEKALGFIQQILRQCPKTYGIKHVLIKTAVHTQQLLIILVTKSEEDVSALAKQIFDAMPEIKGVVQNINPSERNVILGKKFRTLFGQGWIEERLSGLYFKVSPASFFQVNPKQAEALYQKTLELACLTGEEVVLDAYCGVGTLSLLFAKQAKEVIGMECVPEAIVDAKENAVRNHIENVLFICGKAEEKISKLKRVDVALINPPRKGCERAFLEILAAKKPSKILYISCDPATLARDLRFLTQIGYRINTVQPFDMFPQTMHVECLVSLQV